MHNFHKQFPANDTFLYFKFDLILQFFSNCLKPYRIFSRIVNVTEESFDLGILNRAEL